jgi:mycothiol synthase
MQPTAVLPGAYTVRPPELGDAEALFELISAYNLAEVGFADCTLDDVADNLAEPGFDRATDGWLVLAADGRAAGYATTFGKGPRCEAGAARRNWPSICCAEQSAQHRRDA